MPKGFTEKQLKAAELLARNWSQKKVAAEIDTSRTTVIRWLKQPDFRKKVDSLRQKVDQTSTEAFVEVTKEVAKARIKCGAITFNETVELLSKIIRDDEYKLSDRIKAAETLGKWLGWSESKCYQQPPELPSKAFNPAELSRRLEVLRSRAVVASEFLVDQAVASAAQGDIEKATAVLSKSLDFASNCVPDVAIAANTLAKERFVILTPGEYSRLLPEGQKSSAHLLQPLNFDRVFGWRSLKRKSS